MIINKFTKINELKANEMIREKINSTELFIGKIDLHNIETWEQFSEVLGNVFKFPIKNEGFDGTRDWLEDLEWIEKNSYEVYLFNYYKIKNIDLKKLIYILFTSVTEWWSNGVTKFCVDGVAKSFNVYLVE